MAENSVQSRTLTCIICPAGCSLEIKNNPAEENLFVTGNRCPRGADYAQEEIRSPKRVVTATAAIIMSCQERKSISVRRVPVKTTIPCPREKIPALLRDIYNLRVSLPVKAGETLISGWNGEEINVIATRSIGGQDNVF